MIQFIDFVGRQLLLNIRDAQTASRRLMHPYVDLMNQDPLIDTLLGS